MAEAYYACFRPVIPLLTIPTITVIFVHFFISLIIKGGVMNTPFGGTPAAGIK